MSREKTVNEERAHMIEILGKERGLLFYSLQNEFIFLFQKFRHFKELFMKDESRIELLNKAAPFFFFTLQKVLLDDLVMNISRFTESEKQRKFKNATVKGFINRFDRNQLNHDIMKKFNTSLKSANNLNDWRDKRVAHRDFEIHVNSKTISIDYHEVEECISDLENLMKALYSHFFKSDFMYDFFSPVGGAMTLLNHLDYAQRSRTEYLESQRNNRNFNIDSLRLNKRSFK